MHSGENFVNSCTTFCLKSNKSMYCHLFNSHASWRYPFYNLFSAIFSYFCSLYYCCYWWWWWLCCLKCPLSVLLRDCQVFVTQDCYRLCAENVQFRKLHSGMNYISSLLPQRWKLMNPKHVLNIFKQKHKTRVCIDQLIKILKPETCRIHSCISQGS